MSIFNLLFEDWKREQKIKKHKKTIQKIKKESVKSGKTGSVSTPVNYNKRIISQPEAQNKSSLDQEGPQTMQEYELSGAMDIDVLDEEKRRLLDKSFSDAKIRAQSMERKTKLHIECSCDGKDIYVTVMDEDVKIGLWRFCPVIEAEITLFHFNYEHNHIPGVNFHQQTQAKGMLTVVDAIDYIAHHDKARAEMLRKKTPAKVSEEDEDIFE